MAKKFAQVRKDDIVAFRYHGKERIGRVLEMCNGQRPRIRLSMFEPASHIDKPFATFSKNKIVNLRFLVESSLPMNVSFRS